MNRFDNIDCMIGMKEYPDKYFDLAIVDPPYGIGEDGGKKRTRKSDKIVYLKKYWDSQKPDNQYFNELFRVSKEQIIWGGNYFADLLPASRCWLYWQKELGGDFADGELAWTSFNQVLRQYKKRSETFDRIHPTQKPIALYKWLLTKYAKQGDLILDTHVGSASSLIACEDMGFEYVGFEIDKDYFDAANKRLEQFRSQLKLDI